MVAMISPKSCVQYAELPKKQHKSDISLWKNRDFKFMAAVDLLCFAFLVVFMTLVPRNWVNFNIILSSTTSLGAIIGYNVLTYRTIKAQMFIERAKSTLTTAKDQIPSVIQPVFAKLIEFENWYSTLSPEKRESLSKSLELVFDLLWAKVKQLEKRGW